MKIALSKIQPLVELVLGTALTAIAMGMIIIPMNFAAGGVTGLSKVLINYIHVPLSYMVLIVNIILLLLGLIFVGKQFLIKTIAVSLLFPIFLDAFSNYCFSSIGSDPIISVIVAGIILGTGAGLVLRSGASSGGFDIIAVILNKKMSVSIALVLNISDALVILLQALNKPFLQTIYGILVISLSAAVVSKIVTLGRGEAQIMIFSEHFDTIRTILLEDIDVGLTTLKSESGLKQKPMNVIISIVPYRKVVQIKKAITQIDPLAFVVISQVHNVLGKGYTLDRQFNSNHI